MTLRKLLLAKAAAVAGIITALVIALGACAPGENGPSDGPGASEATGIVEVRATDAPADGISSIVVTAANIQVHMAGDAEDGWITVVEEESTFDLLEIAGAEVFLGESEVGVGSYSQVRLDVTEVIVTIDGVDSAATLPSGKLKVVRPWEVREGETTILTLDFEADEFVNVTGQGDVQVRPVLKLNVTQGDRPLKVKETEDEGEEDEEDEGEAVATRVPHELAGRDDCLLCHGADAFEPFPADHAGRTSDTCLGCHEVSASPTAAAPAIPHTLQDREDCLACHAADAFMPFPADHTGRTKEVCRACHSAD